ncbi:MAG: hypothetical protein ACTSUF_11220 [Candidatus Heimdallarchaeaceae archaeon]
MAAGTNYRVFSPEVWSDVLRDYFREKVFAANFFEDMSSELEAIGGDTISIPVITKGETPSSLTTTTGDITDPTFTETRVQLTIDSWIKSSRKFSDFELMRMKNSYNLQNRYLKNDIAPQLAIAFDKVLIGQSGVSGNIQLHTGTSLVAISNTSITECIRIAESYSLPIEEMAFFVHPNVYWGQLFRRTALIDASQLGQKAIAAEQGTIRPLGSLYGKNVYVSTLVGACSGVGADGYPITAKRNLFVHPRSLIYAFGDMGQGRGKPRLQTMDVANALAKRVIGDLAYGATCAGPYEGIRLITVQ